METSNDELVREWKRIDPFLEDLKGFQRFCDIRVAGGAYPLNEEDPFLTVEPVRREWSFDRFLPGVNCIEYSLLRDCVPHETADTYWERNNKAAKAVINLIAEYLGEDPEVDWKPKDALGIPLHINDGRRHLECVKETFGISLTREDFEDAWKLFEHKSWFGDEGYYIKGWLAVAEALGLGEEARTMLETTDYPHADKPEVKEESLCEHMKICPIYHYREWLRVAPIEIPDDVFKYSVFQDNSCYYLRGLEKEWFKRGEKAKVLEAINDPNLNFKVKWKIWKMIRDYMKRPKCRNCGDISYDPERFTGLELCWKCHKLVYKAYRKMNPLAGEYGFPPRNVEGELRQKLIEGDPLFEGITIED